MRIFLSYGHDANEELVRRIKADLESRGHDVWFDKSEIRSGDDWRRAITDGIVHSHRVLSFLSKYSTRDPGVCRDEIAIAIGVKGGNIQTILVESEQEVRPPVNIGHIQWLDMHDWKEGNGVVQMGKDGYAVGDEAWENWYQAKFAEIVRVVESDESRRFAGEIETLNGYLKPIKSEARIYDLLKKGFYGRRWLFEAVENWRKDTKLNSRLFWIMGDPGVGKSAFSARLTHLRGDTVVAAQFCEWDKPDHRDAGQVVRSIAFQLATRLPDYRKLLLTLSELAELDRKNPAELFEYLLANPLKLSISGGRERYLIVIDALDEAGEAGRNPLVEMLARNAQQLPDWIGIVVTSRPEFDVKTPLQGLKPFPFETKSNDNSDDIRSYLRHELATQLKDRPDTNRLVEQILEKSEGVFLYAERFCDDVQHDYLSLDRPEQFPQGLGGIFFQYFRRQFTDEEKYEKVIEPALGAILAAREPLPVEILQKLFGWRETELRKWLRTLGSFFPVTTETGRDVIKPYHKSLADWLVDEAKAGQYFVSVKEGHRMLADFCWEEYGRGPNKMSLHALRHLPAYLLAAERRNDLTAILTSLEWLERKNSAGLVFDLGEDFRIALEALEENDARRDVLRLLDEALRRDLGFIYRHRDDYPQALFQCLWNACWWHDCPKGRPYFRPTSGTRTGNKSSTGRAGIGLFQLLESWRKSRARNQPAFSWLRSLRPPEMNLGTAQVALMRGNGAWVTCMVCSHDGRYIASTYNDGTIRVWDTTTTENILNFRGHEDSASCVSYSRDGRYLVTGGDDFMVRIWDASTGEEVRCLRGHRDFVNSVCFSFDGLRIVSGSGGNDGTEEVIRIWSVKQGRSLRVLRGHKSFVKALAFSCDDRRIVSGSADDTVRIWDVTTGRQLRCMRRKHHGITAVFSPDGQYVASGGHDRVVRIWDAETAEELLSLGGHQQTINSVAYSFDGRYIVSGAADQTVRVWDATSGKELRCLRGHDDSVSSVAFLPQNEWIVSASWDGTIRKWRMDEAAELKRWADHDQSAPLPSPDGKLIASTSRDHSIRLSGVYNGKEMLRLRGHTGPIQDKAFSKDSRLLVSTSSDGTVRIWNLSQGREMMCLEGFEGSQAISFAPDNRRIAIGTQVRSLHNDDDIVDLKRHKISYVFEVSFSPDGKFIATAGNDKAVRIWNASSGKMLRCLLGHEDKVTGVSYSSDGKRIASTGHDDTVRIWNANTGSCLEVISLSDHRYLYGDLDAIATGPPQYPYRIFCDGFETTIVDSVSQECIAWFPRRLRVTHPSGQIWCGTSGGWGRLIVVQLEREGRQ